MSDADCDGIPDTEDESPDYGTGTYGGSSGTNDADNDGIPDGTDPTPYGEGSNGGTDNGNGDGGTDDGRSSGGGGTSSTGSGTSTGSGNGSGTVGTFTPYDWRQECIDTGGRWNGRWCVYAGEVKGECYIDHMYLPDEDPSNGPGETPKGGTVRDQCRYYRGRWYPYE